MSKVEINGDWVLIPTHPGPTVLEVRWWYRAGNPVEPMAFLAEPRDGTNGTRVILDIHGDAGGLWLAGLDPMEARQVWGEARDLVAKWEAEVDEEVNRDPIRPNPGHIIPPEMRVRAASRLRIRRAIEEDWEAMDGVPAISGDTVILPPEIP